MPMACCNSASSLAVSSRVVFSLCIRSDGVFELAAGMGVLKGVAINVPRTLVPVPVRVANLL